jgi:hypothetical protein
MKLRLAAQVSVFAIACALVASPAAAQQVGSNCRTDADTHALTDAWTTTRIGLALAERTCQAKEFVKRLFTTQDDPDRITPGDILDAETPTVDPALQHARDEYAAAQRIKFREEEKRREYLRSNPANEAVTAAEEREQQLKAEGVEITQPFQSRPGLENELYYDEDTIVIPPKTPDGLPTIISPAVKGNSEGLNPPRTLEEFHGEGVVLSEHGIQSGTFEKGELDGPGEEVTENGTWRAGTFDEGRMDGPGLEVGRGDDGRTYLLTGEFDDDLPDGQVTVTYQGGSQRKQLWDDGQLVSQGALAAPGASAADAPPPKFTPAAQVFRESLTYETIPARQGVQSKLEGTFESDGTATGEMIRRYEDGTSQRELWENGKIIGRGAVSAKGGVPPRINRIYKAVVPPPATVAKPAAQPAPAPAPTVSRSGWSSVCERNYNKVQQTVLRIGGVDYKEGMRAYSAYLSLWAPCRATDPQAAHDYDDVAGFLRNAQARGDRDQYVPRNAPFFDEVSKANSDPNYSADLGPVKGQVISPPRAGGGGAPQGSNSGGGGAGDIGGGPAPGTWVGNIDIASPVLGSSFQSKYSAQGLAPDRIDQLEASDADLKSINARLETERDAITRMRLLIAQLEAMIVIQRQSQDYPAQKERLKGMVDTRNQTIEMCRGFATDQSICTTPLN